MRVEREVGTRGRTLERRIERTVESEGRKRVGNEGGGREGGERRAGKIGREDRVGSGEEIENIKGRRESEN